MINEAPRPVIAVTGMRAEARIAARSLHVRAIAGGGQPAELRSFLRTALQEGAAAVVSFGIAGGLAPDVTAGQIVVADAVVFEGRSFSTDPEWRSRLSRALPGSLSGVIAGSDAPVATPAAKAELAGLTGAIAADMESHIAAELAKEFGVPFAVLRVIADDAARGLPPAALAGLGPGGRINIRAVLKSLAKEPSQLPQLMRVSADTNAAMKGLLRCNRLLGPGLGFFDL